jgi:excisionase family DNA binding protein
MEDLFTTHQVQDILKVDRITIYRMLQDGRLKGVKIGHQWRFNRQEVERLLKGEAQAGSELSKPLSDASFPTHCVQAVQNLFSDVSQISSRLVDMQGNLLTEPSGSCEFCKLMTNSPSGFNACQSSWQSFIQQSIKGVQHYTCHAGLEYVGAPIMDNGEQIGLLLTGEFYWQAPAEPKEAERVHQLATLHQISIEKLQSAAHRIPVITGERHTQVETWPMSVSHAIQSILVERTGFIQRLQQIANLTQIP